MTTTSQDQERTKQHGQVSQARLLGLVNRVRELGLLIVLLLIILIVGIQAPRFLSIDNFEQILLSVAILAIAAVGATLVVLTRNVDLSVGSLVGVSAFLRRLSLLSSGIFCMLNRAGVSFTRLGAIQMLRT